MCTHWQNVMSEVMLFGGNSIKICKNHKAENFCLVISTCTRLINLWGKYLFVQAVNVSNKTCLKLAILCKNMDKMFISCYHIFLRAFRSK